MKILLHICCSNCATYPLKLLLDERHDFTGLWFNPNIHPYQEYKLRLNSLKELENRWDIDMLYIEEYKPEKFFRMFGANALNGLNSLNGLNYNLDNFPRSPRRCKSCYSLRLEKTAKTAQKQGVDAFTTTLLISPYQDFEQIVTAGKKLAEKYNILFYFKDFRPYFRDSKALAKELGLYSQKYCGCIFSREERNIKRKNPKLQIPMTEIPNV